MGPLEWIVVSCICGGILIAVLVLLFNLIKNGKKKKQEAAPAPAPAAAPAPKKDDGFKIIRKQSQVKINKKALKAGSRNPSVTKVFVDGKRVDIDESENDDEVKKAAQTQETSEDMSDITPEYIPPFGTREPQYSPSLQQGQAPHGPFKFPNRAPIIGDRTNFASHLNVSDDNNLSGVSGTGIAKAIDKTEKQTASYDEKTNDMLERIRREMLGQTSNQYAQQSQGGAGKKLDLKDIDAKTLILADLINNPRSKKK